MVDPRFPILFITATRIGDAVLSSGLIKRLLDEIPHARFTVVAGPLAAPLFRDIPGLDRVIEMPKEKSGLHWFKLWRQVRGRRWGLVVDLRGSAINRFLSTKRRAIRRPLPSGAMARMGPPSPRKASAAASVSALVKRKGAGGSSSSFRRRAASSTLCIGAAPEGGELGGGGHGFNLGARHPKNTSP